MVTKRLKKQTDIWKMYGGLRYAMKMCGIDLENSKCSILFKPFKYLYVILMHFIVIYFLYIYKLIATFSMSLYFQIMTGLIFSIVVWYLMNCKIVHLKKLISGMKSMKLLKEIESIELKFINSTLIIIILAQVIVVVLEIYYAEYGDSWDQKIFTFNTVFDTNLKNILSRSFLYTVCFMTLYQFPVIATLFCCLLYYQFSTSILHFSKQLKFEFQKNFTPAYIVRSFHRLSRLVDLSNKLNEILSPISFFLISLYVVNLFSLVASIVEISFSNMDIPYMLEYFTALIISFGGISAIIICASFIEKQFLDVERNLIFMHEMYIYFRKRDTFTMELIRYMISMKLPVMTAWTVVELTPSLLFSLVNVCLTFGLLSTQILR